MDTAGFLGRVVPGTGTYLTISWTWKDNQGGWPVRSFPINQEGIDRAARLGRWLSEKKGFDVYHALASYNVASTLEKNGQTVYRAKRDQANAQFMRCLVMDADVKRAGDKKDAATVFPDRRAAAAWIVRFCVTTGMPEPNLSVNSGYGIHFYWILDTPLPITQWRPLAFALRAAMVAHGWVGDTSPTVDAARIMRLPGTMNHKAAPVPVKLYKQQLADYPVDAITNALAQYIGQTQATGTGGTATVVKLGPRPGNLTGPGLGLNAAGQAGIAERERWMKHIVQRCPQAAHSLATGGEGDSYQLWALGFATLGYFTKDGREYFHKLGEKDPRYDRAKSDAVYDRTINEVETKGLGPPTCKSFDGWRPGFCTGCPHHGKITTPLQLGDADNDLPDNYRRVDTFKGRQLQRFKGEEWIPVALGDFHTPVLDRLEPGGYRLTFTYELGSTRCLVSVHAHEVAPNTLHSVLAHQGLTISPSIVRIFGDFIVAWITKLHQANQIRDGYSKPWGWNYDKHGKPVGIAIAGEHYRCDGSFEQITGADRRIASYYHTKGTLDNWRQAAALFEGADKRWDLQAIIGCAFASPLLPLRSDLHGAAINFFSSASGVGKTSAAKVGQAVYGSWLMMSSMNDTVNATMKIMSEPKSFPRYWDEHRLTKTDERDFADMIHQIIEGREKSRMQANTELRETGSWATIMIFCSNRALSDVLTIHDNSTDATALRMLEIEMPRVAQPYLPSAGELLALTERNYGHAGRVYIKWLAENIDTVKCQLDHVHQKVVTDVKIRKEERFHVSLITTIVTGTIIAKQLGLFNFNIKAIYDGLKVALMNARQDRESRTLISVGGIFDIVQIITEFYNHTANDRIRTDRFQGVGKGKVMVIARPTTNTIRVHISETDKAVRLDHQTFMQWLHVKHLPSNRIMEELKTRGAVVDRFTLGSGTGIDTGRTKVIELPLTGDFAGLL